MGRPTVASLAGLSIALAACGGSDSSGGPPGTLAVAPARANVLTCDSLQLAETGGAAGGAWSVSPSSGAGSVSATGDYAAPDVVPAPPTAVVTYAAGGASASATLTLATAFPGPMRPVPFTGNGNNVGAYRAFEHVFSSSGSRVYAAMADPDGLHALVFASPDGGASFAPAASLHVGAIGSGGCVTVAADAGDATVVYLAYAAADGDTSNTMSARLAVSTDGGQSFPVQYVLADAGAEFGCPDVASPSPGHVLVTTNSRAAPKGSSTVEWVSAFASDAQGAHIGPVGTFGQTQPGTGAYDPDVFFAASDTNTSSAQTMYSISGGSSDGIPRVLSNGAGNACIYYKYTNYPGAGGGHVDAVVVQCSGDDGHSWSSPSTIAVGTTQNSQQTGAVSPGGNVALLYQTIGAGNAEQISIVFSKDGGKTFGTPVPYPASSWMHFGQSDPGLPAVRWEGDDILWIAGRENGLLVDKTCDFGATWSGAVLATSDASFAPAGLVATSKGMAAAFTHDVAPTLGLIPLAPQ